ncbi:MAG: LemA protein [Actinomycetota bacterium]|nr:LemA protein [Actinomycetota bacterium]
MKGPLLVAAAIVVFIAVVLLLVYNRFVRLRNMIDESWHDIGTELQRRYDLIPNLVSTVKGYAAHEREVFDSVTALRHDAMAGPRLPDAQAPREEALGQGVARLMAVAENYPDLKASEEFLSLQRALVDAEDRIQVARRIYNANVRSYDTLVQSFPALIMARSFDFQLRPYFEVEPAVRGAGPPSVDLSGQS